MSDNAMPGLVIDIEGRINKLERSLKQANDKQRKAAAEMERRARESAQKIGDSYDKVGAGASRGFDRLGQVFKGKLGWQIQQTATQLGDVAVQIGSGTSAMRAFGMQAAQLLGPFGTVGALAGTAVAALIPLASALMEGGDEAGTLKDRLDELKTSTADMTAAVEAAAVPVSALRTEYGDLADEIARAAGVTAAFAGARAKRDAIGAANSLSGELGMSINAPELPVGWDGSVNADRARMAAQERQEHLDKLREKTGAAGEQLDRLRMAMARVDSSNSLEAVVKDAENLLAVLDGLHRGATEEQRQFLEAWAGQVSAVLDAAKTQIAAQAAEDTRLVRAYDANTQQLAALSADREAAKAKLTAAQKAGDTEEVASMKRVIAEIDAQTVKLRELGATSKTIYAQIASDARTAAADMASGAFQYLTGQTPGQFVSDATTADKGLLELIASKESGGDYNATLDHGRWTGGKRDLVNMSLDEILALGDSMRTSENRALYGNGKGSSALGRYQITGQTLRGLIETLGLTGTELYDPAMQDRLATELIRQRRPQGVDGLRQEWAGLQGVSPAVIQSALGNTPVAAVDPEIERRQTEAQRENTRVREQNAEAARRQGEAISRAGQDAEFEATIIGKSASEQSRLRFVHEQLNRLREQGIDINSKMANSELTYAQAVEQSSQAIARQSELLEQNAEKGKAATEKAAEAEENTRAGAGAMADLAMAGIREGKEGVARELQSMADEILGKMLEQIFAGMMGGFAQGLGGMLSGTGGFGAIGYSQGGYTGDGPKLEPAGVVHRGEFVMSKAAVARLGVGNLESLHQTALRGYAGGGVVGDTGTAKKAVSGVARASAGAPQISITGGAITVNATGGTPEQNADLARQVSRETESAMRNLVRDEMIRQQRPGGMGRR